MSKEDVHLYLDPSQAIEKRVDDLLSKLTIEEKVAQLGSYFPYQIMDKGKLSNNKMRRLLKHGIGQITRVGGSTGLSPEASAKLANEIQKFLKEETRLGIPAIIHEECLCGYTAKDATIFPQIIGVASTWDPDLMKEMTSKIKEQIRVVGGHQALSPVLDVARDPRWGRTEETFGEDPYLIARMGTAYVKGLQGSSLKTGIMATAKHFVGYSASLGGMNWAPTSIPKRELLDVYAKPFEAVIHEANIASVMNAYSEIDGLVCGFSKEILTNLLRDTLGFNGLVVSDYVTIEMCSKVHRLSFNPTDAAILAINAGLDVELPTTAGYGRRFVKAIKKGKVKEELIDRSVKRVLLKKFELGLFENPFTNADPEIIRKIYTSEATKKLAKKIALKSIILLKNENRILPLDKNIKSIAIIGPSADSIRNLFGDYSFVGQFEAAVTNATGVVEFDEESGKMLKEIIESKDPDAFSRNNYDTKSILEAIKEKVSKTTVIKFAKGCDIREADKIGFNEAISIAKNSDMVILVMGGKSGLTRTCTSGEARDRANIDLPGVQEDLVREIYKANKNIVLVLINGRPLSIAWEKDYIPGIIEGWLPGERGGEAIADVLFGDYNPGGKLPISIPRTVGQIPIFHNHKPSGMSSIWTFNYVDINTTPLYPFGYGLSYTDFEYSNLIISNSTVEIGKEVEISFDIKNIGKFVGDEVVQLYMHDREAMVTRPVEELVGFKRITLEPDEEATITFTVSTKQLGFYNENMEFVVEPGTIEVFIGSLNPEFGSQLLELSDLVSKKDMKLRGKFEIIGETLDLSKDKKFFSKVVVTPKKT